LALSVEQKEINFNNLPDVVYAQVDTAEVEKSIITVYEGIMNTTLFPGDPVRLFLSTLAAVIAQQNAISDWTGKQNLLRYATGAYLEHLGAFLQVYRLQEFPAKTVLRFSIAAPRPIATVIPAGTRATADGKIFFATDVLTMISAGNLTADVSATCLTMGTIGNGLTGDDTEGEVSRIVDPIAFVTGVWNIIPTNGGSNTEDDESLRGRIRMQPESFTTAGSELSYVFWSLTAHADIGDVSVFSPIPGYVNIFVMLKGGGIPEIGGAPYIAVKEMFGVSDDPSSSVATTASGKRLRPLTDFITIYPVHPYPDIGGLDYSVEWFITSEQGPQFAEIEEQMDEAIKQYETWQTERAGRDIVPDKLIALCRGAGAKRVILQTILPTGNTPFEFVSLDPTSVVNFTVNPNRLQFGGVEED
jgi:phage-related baseplate assembly protein